jgi:hypothetical protein
VRQLREIVQALSDAGRCDELKDSEEEFDGDAVYRTTFRGRRVTWAISFE